MKVTPLAAALVLAIGIAGCAADDPNRGAKTGAVIGGITGAVIGNRAGDTTGTIIGGAVGALAGAGVGRYMDRQREELERQLADEQARDELAISEMPGDALRVGIASDATFDFDSARLKPDARSTYDRISEVVRDFDKTVIHVVGHTDSTGSTTYNQGLSERRAEAVALHMRTQGVDGNRLVIEGRGESEPLASNQTEAGQRQNRRVDIVIKPIIEGRERQAYTAPPYLGG